MTIRIPDGNAFRIRLTARNLITGEYTEAADLSNIDNLVINYVRRGIRFPHAYTIDEEGRATVADAGTLDCGFYGIELTGYYGGEKFRFYGKDLFEITTDTTDVIDPSNLIDIEITVKLNASGVSKDYVDHAVNGMEASMETMQADLRDEIAEAGKVDDVKVNGASVVSGKKANITVPTKVSDLTNDSGYQTAEDVEQAISTKQDEITTVNIDYEEDGGSPDADVDFENGELSFALKNMKMKFSDLTAAEKEEITGPQGPEGASAIFDPTTGNISAMKQTIGQDTLSPMSQKAVTDEFGKSHYEAGDVILTKPGMEDYSVPDFDSLSMTFKLPAKGGQFTVGRKIVGFPPTHPERVFSLLGVNSTVIVVTVDPSNCSCHMYAYDATIPYSYFIIAYVRVDAANTPTKILNVSAKFPCTIDGKYQEMTENNVRTLLSGVKNVDVNNYLDEFYWINQSGVYTTGGKSVNINIEGVRSISVTPRPKVGAKLGSSAIISFLKTMPVDGESVEFAGDYTGFISIEIADGETTFDVPSDAKVLNVLKWYGTTNATDKRPSAIKFYGDKWVKENEVSGLIDVKFDALNAVDLDIFSLQQRWINQSGVYTIGGKSVNIDIEGLQKVRVKPCSPTSAIISFLKTMPVDGESVEFAGDYTGFISIESVEVERTIDIPSDAKVLNVLMEYNGNSKKPDEVKLLDFYTDKRIFAIEEKLKNTNVPSSYKYIEPYFSTAKKLGSEILQEIQSIEQVGDEIWIASGETSGGGYSGYIYRYNAVTFEYIGRLTHNLEHMNSMSYDKNTDRLLVGGSGSNDNKIYVYGNVSNWATLYPSTTITSSLVLEATITLSNVTYACPVWGEANADGHRMIYVSCNLNSKWLKIKPGYSNGELDGTHTVVWTREISIPNTIHDYAMETLPEYSGTAVCQDLAFHNGSIYTMASVSAITFMKLDIKADGFDITVYRGNYLKDNGDYPTNCANNGIAFVNDNCLVGICNIRNTTENDYSNRIMKLE